MLEQKCVYCGLEITFLIFLLSAALDVTRCSHFYPTFTHTHTHTLSTKMRQCISHSYSSHSTCQPCHLSISQSEWYIACTTTLQTFKMENWSKIEHLSFVFIIVSVYLSDTIHPRLSGLISCYAFYISGLVKCEISRSHV